MIRSYGARGGCPSAPSPVTTATERAASVPYASRWARAAAVISGSRSTVVTVSGPSRWASSAAL